MSLFAIAQPVAAEHSGGFDHQPLPISTSEFGADGDECDDLDLEAGDVVLHWIANQQNVTEPITLTLTLEGGGTISEESTKWNEPGQINSNVTHHFYFALDADVVVTDLDLSTDEGNVRLSHVCRGEENDETVTVIKDLVGDTAGTFDLLINGVVRAEAVGDGGTTGAVVTAEGTVAVSEIAAGSTDLANYTSSITCVAGETTIVRATAGVSVNFTLDDNQDVVCTITNTLLENGGGTLEVDKTICYEEEASTFFHPPVIRAPLGAQSLEEPAVGECDLQPDGVYFEVFADADMNGVADSETPMATGTTTDGVWNQPLDAGWYILVEPATADYPGGSIQFEILDDGSFTIIRVDNDIAVGEDTGTIKIFKFYCPFEAPEGLSNPAFNPEELDNFRDCAQPSEQNELPEAVFAVGGTEHPTDGGILLLELSLDTYTLAEVSPLAGDGPDLVLDEAGEIIIVNVFNFEAPPPPAEMVEVEIMKHLCADVSTVEQFEAIEAAAREEAGSTGLEENEDFAALAATVVNCPTIILSANVSMDEDPMAQVAEFDFTVLDANGQQILSSNSLFVDDKLCETDIMVDVDNNGSFDADVCLDTSYYRFEVEDGIVTITETQDPDGSTGLGTIRFTPGSGDDLTLVGSIADVEASGVITLDTRLDPDNSGEGTPDEYADDLIMVHAYNFTADAAPPAEMVEVEIMKHLCADVSTVEQFEAIEAA
ncbi:MAG: hypothetical protein ACR2H3_15465, partial [Acidimicrobiales bacterium]